MLFLLDNLQIYQKSVSLQCVFHSIRFKVNKGWSTAVLLFLCPYVKDELRGRGYEINDYQSLSIVQGLMILSFLYHQFAFTGNLLRHNCETDTRQLFPVPGVD